MSIDVSPLLAELCGPLAGRLSPPGRSGRRLAVHSPIDGSLLAELAPDTPADCAAAIGRAAAAFRTWRVVPAPERGELVRRIGLRCGQKKSRWPSWSRPRPARSWPKPWAKSRR